MFGASTTGILSLAMQANIPAQWSQQGGCDETVEVTGTKKGNYSIHCSFRWHANVK